MEEKIEHLTKYNFYKKVKFIIDHHDESLFKGFIHSLFSHKSYDPLISEIDNYQHNIDIDKLSYREKLNRMTFAFEKINTFNHHFFNESEQYIISPLQEGAINRTLKISVLFGISTAAFLFYLKRETNFKLYLWTASIWLSQHYFFYTFNHFNEYFHQFTRRAMAKKYLETYDYKFFEDIIDPKCSEEYISKLHNKTYHN